MKNLIQDQQDSNEYVYIVDKEQSKEDSPYKKLMSAYNEFRSHAETQLNGAVVTDLIIHDVDNEYIKVSVFTGPSK